MKTVLPFDKSPQYQNMIDSIAGVVQFATGQGNLPLNRAMCDGIVSTLEDLVEMRPQHNALTRWETAFFVARRYLAALDEKLADLNPNTLLGDALKSEIVTRSKAVSRIVSYTTAEIKAHIPYMDTQTQQGYKAISDTYLPELARLQSRIDVTAVAKTAQPLAPLQGMKSRP